MKKQKLPRGWTEKKIQEVITHYDSQTEEEQAAEIEAAHEAANITMMAVPTELVPRVLELIAHKRGA
jgi:predicted dinucleotide-binding enzyme